MKTVIYPGSFNPFTLGHFLVVRDLSDIFDEVVILIARNGEKENRYEFKDRAMLAKEAIQKDVSKWSGNIKVEILPWNTLLVNYINDYPTSVTLARGVRNSKDFEDETRFFDTVQSMGGVINESFELSRLLIPAYDSFSHISSTIVRSIIGMGDWTLLLKDFVPVNVGRMIISKNIDEFMESMWNRAVKGLGGQNNSSTWATYRLLQDTYRTRPYHNWDHIYNCLLEYWAADLTLFGSSTVMAIFWHDYIYDVLKTDNEEKSAEECLKFLNTFNADSSDLQLVKDGILETKDCYKGTSLVRDIDRAVLGFDWDKYCEYSGGIKSEAARRGISDDTFRTYRKEWIVKTLSESIYTTQNFRWTREKEAKENLSRELEEINKELNE